MMSNQMMTRLSAVGVALTLCSALNSQSIRWLGTLDGFASGASGVSADGAVVAGWSYNASGKQRAFRWTPRTGMQDLGTSTMESYASGISTDGSTIVGWMGTPYSPQGFRWRFREGILPLGAYPSELRATSTFGTVAVGFTTFGFGSITGYAGFYYVGDTLRYIPHEFIFEDGTGTATFTCALAVSGDSATIAGIMSVADDSDPEPVVYDYASVWSVGEPTAVLLRRGMAAYGVSQDGSIVVGTGEFLPGFQIACLWRRPYISAQPEPLTQLYDYVYSESSAISADGTVVVGLAQRVVGGSFRAFRWAQNTGLQELNTIYAGLLNGSSLEYASAVSLDGRYIVGGGVNRQTMRPEAFLLDTWRQGDTNGDGCVSDADLLNVLFAFGTSGTGLTRHEDINDDGIVDDADLLIVLFNFGSGCS